MPPRSDVVAAVAVDRVVVAGARVDDAGAVPVPVASRRGRRGWRRPTVGHRADGRVADDRVAVSELAGAGHRRSCARRCPTPRGTARRSSRTRCRRRTRETSTLLLSPGPPCRSPSSRRWRSGWPRRGRRASSAATSAARPIRRGGAVRIGVLSLGDPGEGRDPPRPTSTKPERRAARRDMVVPMVVSTGRRARSASSCAARCGSRSTAGAASASCPAGSAASCSATSRSTTTAPSRATS